MSSNSKRCIYCKQPLDLTHGNSRYHKPCAYAAKKQRSIKRYAQQNLQIDPYWQNEKILRELYAVYGGQVKINPIILNQKGFNFDVFKTEENSNAVVKIFMHKHGYSIQKQSKEITLCKR